MLCAGRIPAAEKSVRYRLECDDDRFELFLLDESSRVRALAMAPDELELDLQRGRWLIVLVAAWSAPDLSTIDLILDHVDAWPSWLQVGIRPFLDFSEARNWCPTIANFLGSPIWVALRDGAYVSHLVGLHSLGDVSTWLEEVW